MDFQETFRDLGTAVTAYVPLKAEADMKEALARSTEMERDQAFERMHVVVGDRSRYTLAELGAITTEFLKLAPAAIATRALAEEARAVADQAFRQVCAVQNVIDERLDGTRDAA